MSGDLNADSIVLKLSYGDVKFLMTGDLSFIGEKRLLKKDADLRSDVLKVGHHGACDSTSEALLKRVAPQIAIISVGQGNRYGYPCEETIARIKDYGAKIYRTDREETIVIKTNGMKIEVVYDEK